MLDITHKLPLTDEDKDTLRLGNSMFQNFSPISNEN